MLHCVDAVVTIEEPEKLLEDEVELRWQFYADPSTGLTWPVHGQAFGAGPLSTPVDLVKGVGEYYASADCIDLWPDPVEPSASQMAGVRVIFWVHGTDSAGPQSSVVAPPLRATWFQSTAIPMRPRRSTT